MQRIAKPDDLRRRLDSAEVVVSAAEVARAVARLAAEISDSLREAHPVVLVVMNGGVVFAGQLLTQLAFPLQVDYVHVGRYGHSTTGGELRWIAEPHLPLAGRTVLIVDDILDEGVTLEAIAGRCRTLGATRVLTAVFALKALGHPPRVRADFVGVTVPDAFVFGFGMDVDGHWRNLPEIRRLADDEC
jgi:hypoxanthine phosphoribosyltransferase